MQTSASTVTSPVSGSLAWSSRRAGRHASRVVTVAARETHCISKHFGRYANARIVVYRPIAAANLVYATRPRPDVKTMQILAGQLACFASNTVLGIDQKTLLSHTLILLENFARVP